MPIRIARQLSRNTSETGCFASSFFSASATNSGDSTRPSRMIMPTMTRIALARNGIRQPQLRKLS